MKIKKIILPLALSLALVGLASCSSKKKESSVEPETPVTPDPVNPSDPNNPSTPEEPGVDPVIDVDDDADTDSEIPSSGGGQIIQNGSVQIQSVTGTSEAAVITFKPYSTYTDYNVYIKGSNDEAYKKLTSDNLYITSGSTYRADILGLKKGNYAIKVSAAKDGNDVADAGYATISVVEYDRSGYAHFNYNEGVGAYNDDGTLKENAKVLYVTDENKNDIELTIGDTTVKGIGNILNTAGMESGTTGANSNGGAPNTNNGIIMKAAQANIPLDIRFIGTISETGLYEKGTYDASDAGLIDGLTEYKSVDYGGSVKDNGHMARMKNGKNITIEGIGEDSCLDGWGLHFMASSAEPELGKSFEVRNLKFINTPEDAVGMEGIQGVWKDAAHTSYEGDASASSDLIGSVERCWVHNNEFYSPKISNPSESDKSEGDGSCDFKRGQYFTCSYNYFEGCHKTNLVGSSDSSLQFNLTYHHNFWYMCKARGPLTRRANVHMYNNYFYGQTDYALNTRADAYIFSEFNQFYFCKSPYAVEAGAIKSYKDSVSSYISAKGSMATTVTNKSQTVANNCKFTYRNIDYSTFDTDSTLSYIPSNDYELQTNVTDALKVIYSKTGITKDTQINPNNVTLSDISLLNANKVETVISKANPTVNNVSAGQTVTPGKISKTAYAFRINDPMTVTVQLSGDGVLVNEAGVLMLSGSGSIVLEPGVYFIQPTNIQPGDAGTLAQGTFKEVSITSVEFAAYDSSEYNQAKITEYNQAVSAIPSTIEYNENCYNAIKYAIDLYNNLGALKESVDFTKVSSAYNTYSSLGITAVENAIAAIGTVSQSSGPAITSARNMYNTLISRIPNATVSNYQTLQAAEEAFESYAVSACVEAIAAIGTVTLDSKTVIEYAESLYSNLDDTQKSQVTNYSTLTAARATYTSLAKIQNVIELIDGVDLSSDQLSELKTVIDAFNALSAAEAASVTNVAKLDDIKVTYTIKSIDVIPSTITLADKESVDGARAAYDALNTTQRALVTNYSKLESAEEQLAVILSQSIECLFTANGKSLVVSNDAITVTSGSPTTNGATIAGVSYTSGLKMESSTNVSFTTTAVMTLTLHITAGQKVKVDGTSYTIPSTGVLVVENLAAKAHTITKDTTNTYLYYLLLS